MYHYRSSSSGDESGTFFLDSFANESPREGGVLLSEFRKTILLASFNILYCFVLQIKRFCDLSICLVR